MSRDKKLIQLGEAWAKMESLVAREPFEGPVSCESDKTHMGTFHGAPFEIKQPMDDMNILIESALRVINDDKYDDHTKVHVIKGLIDQIQKDHEQIHIAISKEFNG